MRTRFFIYILFLLAVTPVLRVDARAAQEVGRYEGRQVAGVEIANETATLDAGMQGELLQLVQVEPNTAYSAVEVRESLAALFGSGRVNDARVEVIETAPGDASSPVRVRFIVRPQPRVAEATIELIALPGTPLSEDELRARLNLLEPGARVTPSVLNRNADLIQTYLRDRGFYRATVEPEQTLDPTGTRSTVVFRVRSGEQARVAPSGISININGFNSASVRGDLELQPGEPFSSLLLAEDVARVREELISQGYLAPQINSDFKLDSDRNTVAINLTGATGPEVNVAVRGYDIGEDDRRELLPVLREGTIDQSAIIEGERRLENRLQEEGYFFADVVPSCVVTPPLPDVAGIPPGTPEQCALLNPDELAGREVNITYNVETNRRYSLTDIRIEGTDALSAEDPELLNALRTQERSVLGIIPFLGYGRGYTSEENLNQDRQTLENRLRELGYRQAQVDYRLGVSLDDEDLIVTFVVEEGSLTRVADATIRGNNIYTTERVREQLEETIAGAPFARAQARRDAERILALYQRNGYINADVNFDIVELPRDTATGAERVRLLYTINEGDKVYVNRIFINGNTRTERDALLKVVPLREGDLLRLDLLSVAERELFNSGAFRNVVIRTEPAGETPNGFRRRDIIIEVEEIAPRVTDYTVGYSTDNGALGGFDFRNTNLFGKLQQGVLRIRASQRQQLARIEFIDPRFRTYDSDRKFAPLILSVQYQRDTNVTRFFRSTIDRGERGIVQRLNAEGNPINTLGEEVSAPSINRFTFRAETRREFERRRNEQGGFTRLSTLLLSYSYEDVRLLNTGSLLIAPLLEPDRNVRLSRLNTSFARDTRDSATDTTSGQFVTIDYSLALRQLGGNLSYSKLQTNYRNYFALFDFRDQPVVFAGSVALGIANLFNPRDRDGIPGITPADRRLPISERFFTGGSTTLRGFDFEQAGPRIVVAGGNLLNENGEPITVTPFTIPVGGNALGIVNLEARVPVTKQIQVVPFYDGGNIFERVGDLFNPGARRDAEEFAPQLPGIVAPNINAKFTHTVGLGLRFRTPFGALGIDYGFLLNPPRFEILQGDPLGSLPSTTYILPRTQFHLRFGQAF